MCLNSSGAMNDYSQYNVENFKSKTLINKLKGKLALDHNYFVNGG
jgi:hypothetical protein